jgi:hypothetical protein
MTERAVIFRSAGTQAWTGEMAKEKMTTEIVGWRSCQVVSSLPDGTCHNVYEVLCNFSLCYLYASSFHGSSTGGTGGGRHS